MARKSTLIWRSCVIAVMGGVISVGLNAGSASRHVDTDAMLDVSVSIKTISHVRIDAVGDSVWDSGSGSGFLVASDGCEVWTNHHVIENAAVIQVFPRGWSESEGIPASVVNSTPRNDLAILRMAHCEGIPQARLGESESVKPGDETYVVGNPLGQNPDSISRGIISHTERFVNNATAFLQTDAAINPGNSGGALFDRTGHVIGISTAIAATRSGSNVGIGYALPIHVARRVAKGLHDGPPSWGDAGLEGRISTLTPEEAAVFHVPGGKGGIILTATPEDGPAAGKLRQHDVVYRIADIDIVDTEQALRLVSNRDAGAPLTFDLVRGGDLVTTEVTLAEGWKAGESKAADHYAGYLGMDVEMWNETPGEQSRFEHPVITRVHGLGPAHRARVASSQRAFGFRGPFMVPLQLDVKTITGAVLDGAYHAVADLGDLERLSEDAFRTGAPLLLEIELWARANPMNPDEPLQRKGTAFFRIDPARTTAAAPDESEEAVANATPPAPSAEAAPAGSTDGDDASAQPVKYANTRGWEAQFFN
jgi:S1-C subfamily serine protease